MFKKGTYKFNEDANFNFQLVTYAKLCIIDLMNSFSLCTETTTRTSVKHLNNKKLAIISFYNNQAGGRNACLVVYVQATCISVA